MEVLFLIEIKQLSFGYDDNQISELSSKKRYSLNPRVEIEIREDGSGQDDQK